MSSNIRVNSITPSVGNSVAIGTAGGTVTFNNAAVVDVDGHTELDNVNISGVVTATSFAGPLTGNVTGNVTGDITGNITGNVTGTATTATALSGSPSITVTDITASGNVSIAGTLTYEDVTNIDSVGIVTAQSGIKASGESTFNGNVGIQTNDISNSDLVGAGNSFVGMYIGDGFLAFSTSLSRPDGYYISTSINALNAGPVTLGSTMTLDGTWVIV